MTIGVATICSGRSDLPFGLFLMLLLKLSLEIGMVEFVVECQWLLRGNDARLYVSGVVSNIAEENI